jgi:antitoxin component of MazEF toxin-antitoxin module
VSRRATYSPFGESVSNALADSQMTQVDLAKGADVSVSYVNNTMTGRKAVSPTWADLVADVTKASAERRTELHRGAALAAGYKLDLTPADENSK